MLNHNKNAKKVKFAFIVVLFLVLDIVLFSVFCARLRPVVEAMALNNAKNMAISAINNAVDKSLGASNIDYDKIMTFEKNNNGDILAVKANTIEINHLKDDITNEVVKEVNDIDSSKLSVPVGTIVGGELFTGRGPNVHVKIDNVGNVKTKVVNQFTSAGINQTRQQITIEVTISVTVLVSSYTVSTDVATNCPVADTIIVGNVPNNYTVIDENAGTDKTAEKIHVYSNSSK